MKKSLYFIFLFTVIVAESLWAQTFPVTVVPQTVPPSPIYFSSYADAASSNSPLRLQILLNDLSQSNREIRLKASFEGNGIRFESNDLVVGARSLFLEGGVPLNLTNVELAPYFAFENITGISPTAYGQPIPEGSYQFCFEVFDVLTGARISQRSCATTYIFQNEPPILIAPNNRIDIREQNPLNLLFQWTPRHINVSNVQYELSIVEIWDQTMDPQAAFLASPPIFQTTTSNTSYLYSAADPLLLSNKRYAWRVQAKAINGAEEIGLFNNNGFSEVFWFNHVAPCETPANVQHEVKGAQQANITWEDFTTSIPQFTVRYREEGQNNEWFFTRTTGNWITLWDLQPGTTYEYQVGKKCLISESDYSILQTFTTLTEDDEEGLINCGISPDLNIDNMEPLEQLLPGNVFQAGDFPVKVTEVSGSNGRFTGKGYVSFPYFKNIKVAVDFTNIFVNNDNELAEGTVLTVYDPSWGNVLDIDEVIDVGEDIIDVFTGGDNEVIDLNYDIDENDISITDGQIIITKPDGTTDTFDYDEGDSYTITDVNGDTYTIDKDGNISQTGQADPSPQLTADNADGIKPGSHTGTMDDPYVDTITNGDVRVTFRTGDDTQFALDLANNEYENANYPKINSTSGQSYYPAHKAAVQGEEDVFYADIEISNSRISIDSLIIKSAKNKAIKHQRVTGTNTYKITVSGVTPYRTEECVITYLDPSSKKYKVAANFFIHHITKQNEVPVQVVTVNRGGDITNLEQELNSIFGVAGGRFKVKPNTIDLTIAQSSWDENNNNIIDYDGSGLLSDYPTEFKNIYKEFKKQYPNYDSKQYFIFVLGKDLKVSKPLSGFMPKTRQWGFVFESHLGEGLEKKNTALKVAAHELGHGVFTLTHPFGEDANNSGSASTWLMDYGDGIELGYPNWATMSDPDLDLFLFQDDEGGESTRVGKIPSEFQNENNTYTFMTVDGNYLTLPSNVQDLIFITGLDEIDKFIKYPTGAIASFTINDKKYNLKTTHKTNSDTLKINDFDFIYQGFETKKGEQFKVTEANKEYFGNIITFLPKYGHRELGLKKVAGLTWNSSENVNILKNYTKYVQFYPFDSDKSRKYKYQESSPFDTSYKLDNKLVGNILGESIRWNSLYPIVSKIAVLNNAYPDIIKIVTPSLLSQVPSNQAHIALKTKKVDELISIYIELLNGTRSLTKSCVNTLSNIQEGANSEALITCIKALNEQEIKQIPIEDKLMVLSIVLNDWRVDDSEEIQLIRLLKFTQNKDVDSLLLGLADGSKLSDKNYTLIQKLVHKVDNDHVFFTEDNYKTLINTLAELAVKKSPTFKKKFNQLSVEDILERNIKFYYRSLWAPFYADWVLFWKAIQGDQNLFTYNTKARWVSEKSSNLEIKTTTYLGNKEIDETDGVPIAAFDPIYFSNKSSLSMLNDYNQDKAVLAPAVLAYYAYDVGNTKTIIDGIQATVDVVSLATGYGALTKAPSLARKVFIVSDMIGSGVSLTTSVVGYESLSPEAKNFVDALNILTATVAITEIANPRNFKGIFSKIKNNPKPLPSENEALIFLDKLLDAEGKLKDVDLNKLKEARIWLAQLEMESSLGEISHLKDKIRKAKGILNKELVGIAGGIGDDIIKNATEELLKLRKKINPEGSRFNCVGCAIEFQRKVSLEANDIVAKYSNVPSEEVETLIRNVFGWDNVKRHHAKFNADQLFNDVLGTIKDKESVILLGKLRTPRNTGVTHHAFNAVRGEDGAWKIIDVQEGVTYTPEFVFKEFLSVETFEILYENVKDGWLVVLKGKVNLPDHLYDWINGASKNLLEKLNDLPNNSIENFISDFGGNSDMLSKFDNDSDLLETWRNMEKRGMPSRLRKNSEVLTKSKQIDCK